MIYKNILIEKIEDNAFEEAIELLFPEIEDKEVLNTLSIYRSRINKIKSEKREGTIKSDEFDLEWNKIRSSLLGSINELNIPSYSENHEHSPDEPDTKPKSKKESLNTQTTQQKEKTMFNKLHNNLIQVNLDSATKSELKNYYECICEIEREISSLEQNYHFIPAIIKILINLETQLNETKMMLKNNGFQNSKIDYKSRELYSKTRDYLKQIAEIKRNKKTTEANEYIASFVIPYLEFELHNYKSELIK